MITKIEEKEIMTRVEARRKYKKHYICMAITHEKMHDPDNAEGYVIYITDTQKETYQIPRRLDNGLQISKLPGMALGGIEMGGLIFNE
jgi:hypothetical protein